MERSKVVKVGAVMAVTILCLASFNCATICHPSRSALSSEERGSLDFGMLVLDILFTPGYGLLGIIIDFATGCVWLPNEKGLVKLNRVENEDIPDPTPSIERPEREIYYGE